MLGIYAKLENKLKQNHGQKSPSGESFSVAKPRRGNTLLTVCVTQ